MGIFKNSFSKPGPGIPKDLPKKTGLVLLWSTFRREWLELIKLNLLYTVVCIPIITIPAATTAMSRITLTMLEDQNVFLWQDFKKAFKDDFLKSLFAGLIQLILLAAGAYGVYFYYMLAGQSQAAPLYLLMGLCVLICLTVITLGYYLYPMIALVDLPLGKILKNSLLLSNICLGYTAVVLAVQLILVFLCVYFLPYSFGLVFMIVPALCNLISSFAANAAIKKYIIPGDKPAS